MEKTNDTDDNRNCLPDNELDTEKDNGCNGPVNNAMYDHMYSVSFDKRLKICTINVCGLKSKLLYPEFEDFLDKYDIICVTESKLDKFDSIKLDNYSIMTNNRSIFKSKSGGIALLFRNDLCSYVKLVAKSDCML